MSSNGGSANGSPAPSRGRRPFIPPAVPNIDYSKFRGSSTDTKPSLPRRSESFSSFTTPSGPQKVANVGGSSAATTSTAPSSNASEYDRSTSVPPDSQDESGDPKTCSRNTWRNRKRRMRRNKARRAASAARSEAEASGAEVDPNFAAAIHTSKDRTLSGVNAAMSRMTISDGNNNFNSNNFNGTHRHHHNYANQNNGHFNGSGPLGSPLGSPRGNFSNNNNFRGNSRTRSGFGGRGSSPVPHRSAERQPRGPLPGRLECLKNRKEKKAGTELRMAYVTVIPSKYANDLNQIIRNAYPQSIPELQHLRRFVRPENVPKSVSGAETPHSTPDGSRSRSSRGGHAHSRERSDSVGGSPGHRGNPHFGNNNKRGRRNNFGGLRPLYVLLCFTSLMSLPELYELLSSHELFSPNAQGPLPAITPHPVPKAQPASAEQARMLSDLYWPTVYRRGNPYGPHPNIIEKVETLLMRTISPECNLHFPESTNLSCAEYYTKLARLVADEGHDMGFGIRSGAVVVDFTDIENKPFGEVIAVAADGRGHGHPLAHAPMRAIQLVGRKRVELSKKHDVQVQRFDMNNPTTPLEKFYFDLTQTKKDGYLMHNLHVFVTHEPCIMCSMGLVHSRICACTMGRQMKQTGGLHADLAAPPNPMAARLLAGENPVSRARDAPVAPPAADGLAQPGGSSRSRSVSQYFDAKESQSPAPSPSPQKENQTGQQNGGNSPVKDISPNRAPQPNGSLAPTTKSSAQPVNNNISKPVPAELVPETLEQHHLEEEATGSTPLVNDMNHDTEQSSSSSSNGGVSLYSASNKEIKETSPVRIDEIPFVSKQADQASSTAADEAETLTVWDVEELRRGRSRVPAQHRPGAVKDGYSLFWRDRLNWKFLSFQWHDAQEPREYSNSRYGSRGRGGPHEARGGSRSPSIGRNPSPSKKWHDDVLDNVNI